MWSISYTAAAWPNQPIDWPMDTHSLQAQRILKDHPPPLLDPTWESVESLFSRKKPTDEAIKREALRKIAEMKRKLHEKRQKEREKEQQK